MQFDVTRLLLYGLVLVLVIFLVTLIVGGRGGRLMIWLALFATAIDPNSLAFAVSESSVSRMQLAAALVVIVAASVRGSLHPAQPLVVLVGLLCAYFVLRAGTPEGLMTVGRVLIIPMLVALALGALALAEELVWRDVQAFLILVVVTAPVVNSLARTQIESLLNPDDSFARYSSLVGTANYLSLAAAALVLIALLRSSRRSTVWASVLVGVTGLLLSRGLAATLGLLVAWVAVVAARSGSPVPRWAKRLSIVALVIPLVLFVILRIRTDALNSLTEHWRLAAQATEVFKSGNPVIGVHWRGEDGFDSSQAQVGFHNFYLDMLAFTGVLGVAGFAVLLMMTARRGGLLDRGIVILVAIWLNTTGAFPNLGMGLLAVCVANVIRRDSADTVSLSRRRRVQNPSSSGQSQSTMASRSGERLH